MQVTCGGDWTEPLASSTSLSGLTAAGRGMWIEQWRRCLHQGKLVSTNCKNKWADWRQYCAFWLLCTYRFALLKANLNIEESVRCATDWLCWTEFAEFETFCNHHFGHSGLEVRRYSYNCSIFFRIARRCIYKAVIRTCECQVLDPGLAVLTGGPLSKGMDLSPGRIVATLQHFCLYT